VKKERVDLPGRSGRGRLVLICAQCCRPHHLLLVNKLRRRPAGSTYGRG